MKEHIIRAILYQDMSVKWKDAELNGDVNVHLNVHQKTRQIVEAELDDFLLNDGEAILASFEKTIDGEIYHENPVKMDKMEGERRVFRLRIPTIVHNTPGEWGIQFFVVTDYDPITGNYTDSYPFDKAKFSEHSSFIDDGLTVPTGENLSALYAEAKAAAANAEANADKAKAVLNEFVKHLKSALVAKYDKAGGTISGDVVIQGNLSVAGKTTTQDMETVQAESNILVTNKNGVDLIDLGGFAIKTDTTNAYGIMYDPVGDGVKIGLGTFDENGKFTFLDGEAQFLATRADEIADGNLVQWDAEKRMFVDSGVSLASKADKTDLPEVLRW